MSASILEAVVRIRPDVDALRRDTKKAGDAVEKEMDKVGKQSGKKLGDGLADGLHPDKNGRLRDSRGRFKKALEDDVAGGLSDGMSFDKNGRLRDSRGRFVKGFGDAADQAGGRFSSAFAGRMQSTGAAMTAGITAPLLLGMNMAVNAAGDLNETLGASEQIFGSSFQTMKTWADGALDSMGLAASTVLGAANSMGAMFIGMGVTEDTAARMTQGLIERARDLAMLYNVSSEEMLTAIRSGMSGEMEPLKRFGVILSQTAVEAEAVSSGLVQAQVDTTKLAQAQVRAEQAGIKAAEALNKYGEGSLEYRSAAADAEAAEASLAEVMAGKVGTIDQATLAQARMQLLMRQSAIAAGQYKREEDSLAATTERTREQTKQLAEEYGQKLLPVKLKLLEAVSGLLDFFNGLPGPMQNIVVILGVLAAAAGPLIGALGTLMMAWNGVAASAGRAAMAQQLAMGGGRMGGLGRLGLGAAGAAGAGWGISNMGDGVNAGNALATIGGGAALGASIAGPWGALVGGLAGGAWTLGQWAAQRQQGMALGGTVGRGGLVTVGERGPEVLALPGGAQVSPNGGLTDLGVRLDRIADLLANGTGGMRVEVVNAAGMDERRLARELDALSRRASATRTTGRTR